MRIAARTSPITLAVAAALLLLAGWLVLRGIVIVQRPTVIAREAYRPAVPLEGPYTKEELKQAALQLASFLPQHTGEAPSMAEIHAAAEAERQMERARMSAWQRHRELRIQAAAQRRPLGWTLIALGSALLLLWALAGYRLWTAR